MCGDLSNPLLVVPLQPVVATDFPSVNKPVEKDLRNDLVGAGYQDFEDSVMKKLQKARTFSCFAEKCILFNILPYVDSTLI